MKKTTHICVMAESLDPDDERLDPIPEHLISQVNEIVKCLHFDDKNELQRLLRQRNGAFRLASSLPQRVAPKDAASRTPEQLGWELLGHYYRFQDRNHEALVVFDSLYRHMLRHQQDSGTYAHKGMPLVWMSDCHVRLGHPIHAKRYLMLTLCEDSIRDKGKVDLQGGPYFRLVWRFGLSPKLVENYSKQCWAFHEKQPTEAMYPERVLAELDQEWMSEVPALQEASIYHCNVDYVKSLLTKLGTDRGRALEYVRSIS